MDNQIKKENNNDTKKGIEQKGSTTNTKKMEENSWT